MRERDLLREAETDAASALVGRVEGEENVFAAVFGNAAFLGARTRDIVRLLVWQFSRPVIIANVIAWPIAWWLMRDWLNTFDQRIPLTPIPFIIAAAIALGIAVATIVGHAIKVARGNPIHALRYE